MKQILLLTLCVLAVLTSCKPNHQTETTFTVKRVDISGAKFLTIASSEGAQALGKAATGTSQLYKIDENGNMTAVVFYIEVDSDGNKTTVNATGDIKVTPEKIIDYGKQYMLFYDCTIDYLTDKYPRSYDSRGIYLLVRKSDGAIFEVGSDQIGCFPIPYYETDVAPKKIAYNDRGELYMIGNNNNVSKLKLENGKVLLQQLTTGIYAGGILLDKNDNLYVTSNSYSQYNICWGNGIMYFANGGITLAPFLHKILLIDREYYVIEYSDSGQYPDYIHTTKLHKMNLDAPNLSLQEIATTTSPERSGAEIAIDSESRVLLIGIFYAYNINTYMVFDKSTKQLSVIPLSDGFDKVQYNTQGVAYEYSAERCSRITRYNIVDMTKKTIYCDRSAVLLFIQKETKQTLTDFFEFGIKEIKGAPICVQTNLETGKVTVIENADNRTITELIRVS